MCHRGLGETKGYGLTLSDIRDTHGNILFNVGQKMLAIHKTFVCEDASGKEVLRVQKKMSCE